MTAGETADLGSPEETLPPSSGHERTEKGARTRRQILEAAMSLLPRHGYDGTSMRAIAREAGVSVGNAYYYFPSKSHLIQAVYLETHQALERAAAPILARERTLEGRLRGVLWAWFKIVDPLHDVAGAALRGATETDSALNPFSPEASGIRDFGLRIFHEVVAGSSSRVPEELEGELPSLLWTAHVGAILFWIHDRSAGRQRTRILIDRAPGLVVRLIALSRLPGLGDIRRQLQALLADLAPAAFPADSDPPPGPGPGRLPV